MRRRSSCWETACHNSCKSGYGCHLHCWRTLYLLQGEFVQQATTSRILPLPPPPPPLPPQTILSDLSFFIPTTVIERYWPHRAVKTVKGTRSFHHVKPGGREGLLASHLTCFCSSCLNNSGEYQPCYCWPLHPVLPVPRPALTLTPCPIHSPLHPGMQHHHFKTLTNPDTLPHTQPPPPPPPPSRDAAPPLQDTDKPWHPAPYTAPPPPPPIQGCSTTTSRHWQWHPNTQVNATSSNFSDNVYRILTITDIW